MPHLLKIACIFLFFCHVVSGQDQKNASKKIDSTRFKYSYPEYFFEEPSWRLGLPIWIPGFRGSFAYGDIGIDPGFGNTPPGPGDPDEDEKLRQSKISIQFYLLANIEYRYKRFFIEADGMKAVLDNDITFTDRDRLSFGGTIDATILRGFAGYKFFERAYQEKLIKWSLRGYVGIRFFDVRVAADRLELLDVRLDWTDPIVGISAPFAWRRWIFSVQGDFGGLARYDHSSLYAAVDASYRFSRVSNLGLSWTYLNAKYEGEVKGDNLELGMELIGPAVRLNFSF